MMFSERPVILLGSLMHDTERDASQPQFVQILSNEFAQLHEKCVLVINCEPSVKTTFRTYHSAMVKFRCWNHASPNVKAEYFLRDPRVTIDMELGIRGILEWYSSKDMQSLFLGMFRC